MPEDFERDAVSHGRKRSIRFTWGGRDTYNVNLCFRGVSLSNIYETVAYGLTSEEAQEMVRRGNEAIKKWRPDLVSDEL